MDRALQACTGKRRGHDYCTYSHVEKAVYKHLLSISILLASAAADAGAMRQSEVELRKIQGISVEVLTVDEGQLALQSETAANINRPNHLTLVSSTDESVGSDLRAETQTSSKAVAAAGAVYLHFPFDEVRSRLSKHARDQYNFYRSDKAAVILLTVLTANTSVNWFIFSPEMYSDSAAVIVGINAFLYAYLGVNAPNWAQILRSSKVILQKSKTFSSLNSKLQDFISIFTTNTAYNLSYQTLIQSVLHWGDVESFLGGDIIGLILKNTAVTVAASGMWDLVLNEWQESGKISASTRKKLSWGRSVIMVTLGNLMALGLPNALEGMLAFGATGLSIYLVEVNKVRARALLTRAKSVKNLSSRRGLRKILMTPFKRKSATVSAGYCGAFLNR